MNNDIEIQEKLLAAKRVRNHRVVSVMFSTLAIFAFSTVAFAASDIKIGKPTVKTIAVSSPSNVANQDQNSTVREIDEDENLEETTQTTIANIVTSTTKSIQREVENESSPSTNNINVKSRNRKSSDDLETTTTVVKNGETTTTVTTAPRHFVDNENEDHEFENHDENEDHDFDD